MIQMNAPASSTLPQFSQRQVAWVAGITSLILFVAAMVAELYARQRLVVPGDAAQTAQHLLTEGLAFRVGLLCYLVVVVGDIVLAWALYLLFAPIQPALALLTAWLRVVYAAVLAVSLQHLWEGLALVQDLEFAAVVGPVQAQAQAMLAFRGYEMGWAIGMVVFGLHVLLLGYLTFRSGWVPRLLGVILLLTGVAYMGDNLAKLLWTDYAQFQGIFVAVLAPLAILGELGLGIWLLARGGKTESH
jgi:hypothetical protein